METTKFPKATVGIIGGSGLEKFPEIENRIVTTMKPKTKYGYPSDKIIISNHKGKRIAFLPRHGYNHNIPPNKIPYKANIAALKMIGVRYILATCTAVSLKKLIKPGSLVLLDQMVNLTWGRDDYFTVDKSFLHLPFARPYCPTLRKIILTYAKKLKIPIHKKGTIVVIQGPRFSTIAESKWFIEEGWDLVNMTQYPECYFAREAGICYATIASVTDYDVGIKSNIKFNKNNYGKSIKTFNTNTLKVKNLILEILNADFSKTNCTCQTNDLKPYYIQNA